MKHIKPTKIPRKINVLILVVYSKSSSTFCIPVSLKPSALRKYVQNKTLGIVLVISVMCQQSMFV